jgi:predicted ATPase/DNA-binding CsgD family transcriptional regulator
MEIAGLVALGLTNREIASRLFLSERTVEWHVEQILNKLGFSSRSQIAAWMARSQLETPIREPDSRNRGNLPAQFTSFVGRDSELRVLLDLVTSNRLVTVTGPGGTGKTRLALRLGEELQADFTHGVWLCDLAPVAEPNLVGDAIAQALGAKRAKRDPLEAIKHHLRHQSALLVLDNCEHVAGTVEAIVRHVLEACPGVRIAATSRSPLGIIGEAVFRLDPLPEDDALRLFKDRAQAAVPNFTFDASTADTIAVICRRLDGLPLAIELAVPRLRVQSPMDLAEAIFDPAWRPRSAGRHASLNAVTQWSYGLTKPTEQSLFRHLGVFAGWFDAQDAIAVAEGVDTAMAAALGSLAEQSMLVVNQQEAPLSYRLLEFLKAFALQRMEEAGELEHARLAHAEHMVSLAERFDPMGGGDTELRRKLTSMVDDVRAALGVLLHSRPEHALSLSAAMMATWRHDGRYQEGLTWNEQALAANPQPSPQRCRSLFQQAFTLAELGHRNEAYRWLGEAEEIADQPGNEDLRLQTLIARANCYSVAGDFVAGLHLGQDAIDAFERLGDDDRLAVALNHTSLSLLSLGQLVEGRSLAQRALDKQERVAPGRLATLDTLAQAHALLGELHLARRCWLEAIERGIEIGWKNGIPFCLFGLAFVAGLEGDREHALRLHFVAERLNADLNLSYYDPIAAPEAELIGRLTSEVGMEVAERIRSESWAIEPTLLLPALQIRG